ncbi:MAG: aromatic amino acid ammonia-lyase [Candidatus Falkowbacteria bacterium]
MERTISLDGRTLTLQDVVLIARGYRGQDGHQHYPYVELSEQAQADIGSFRHGLDLRIAAGDIIYGVNTGCGVKKGTIIDQKEIDAYQAHYIPAHCVGYGEPFDEEIVRAALVLRVNSFALGNSGIRLETCNKLLEIYNKGVIPFVPEQGSVGSSGDLCPLAHVAAVITGVEGQQAFYHGKLMQAAEALSLAGIDPIVLKAKEAMGLTNGATLTLAMGLLAIHDSKKLIAYSHMAAALSLEAIRGEKNAFDPRIHEARKNQHSARVAKIIRDLTSGSDRMTTSARDVCLTDEKKSKKYQDDAKSRPTPRVQDAYSFRAYAQVAGPVVKAFEYAEEVFLSEMNAATDNPLIFKSGFGENERFEAISGGNFHGEPLGQAADFLKIAIQQLANISDRRFYALTMSTTSYGLPDDLAGAINRDLNTGLMILQYTTAALVSENKALCYPSVIDSIPTSANQEDYVSMSTIGARNLRKVIKNTYGVIGAELLAAAQGISLTEDQLRPLELDGLGRETTFVYKKVRQVVAAMYEDRYIHKDFKALVDFMIKSDPQDFLP